MEKQVIEPLIETVDLEDDRFHFEPVSQMGTSKSNPISVDKYFEDGDLQVAISASLYPTTLTKGFNIIDLDDYDDNEIRIFNFEPVNFSSFKNRRKLYSSSSVYETGQSSNFNVNPTFLCEICIEPKNQNKGFSIKGCSHSYCTDCMAKYVASKLQENVTNIKCPVFDCVGLLEPEYCRSILPKEVFDRWGNALCEAVILGSEKFYCPYKDCSAMLVDDGKEVIKESECPNCWRLFCVQCKVPWHPDIECVEFQKLNKDEREREDIMLMNLAQNKHWRRCPNCKFYVEKSEGCLYMKCRSVFFFR